MTPWLVVRRAALLGAATLGMAAQAQYSTPMRDVENPDRTLVMLTGSATIEPPYVNNFIFLPTPAGKRLFLDKASISCTLVSGTDVLTQVQIASSQVAGAGTTSATSYDLAPQRRGPGTFGGVVWTGSADLRQAHDAAAGSLVINLFHSEPANPAYCTVYLAGHTLP